MDDEEFVDTIKGFSTVRKEHTMFTDTNLWPGGRDGNILNKTLKMLKSTLFHVQLKHHSSWLTVLSRWATAAVKRGKKSKRCPMGFMTRTVEWLCEGRRREMFRHSEWKVEAAACVEGKLGRVWHHHWTHRIKEKKSQIQTRTFVIYIKAFLPFSAVNPLKSCCIWMLC